jgi:hypothetical protein
MRAGMKVLFLTTVLPGKRRMGSEVASQAVIDALTALGASVTVVGYVRRGDDYRPLPGEVVAGRKQIETGDSRFFPLLWLAQSLLRDLPYSVAKFMSGKYVSTARRLLDNEHYDLVVCDHVQMSRMLERSGFDGRTVGLAHNVEHQMYRSFVSSQPSPVRKWIFLREANLLERMERAFADHVDQMWTFTGHDAGHFRGIMKNPDVRVIPLPASEVPGSVPQARKEFDIGLIGSWTWKANDESLRWFLDAVYPHCPPDLSIQIAGSGADWVKGLYPNIHYAGFVESAREFLEKTRVVAIPTLSGGGIQIKTLDAIASGSMIVATPVALRGISEPPLTVACAETPADFAAGLAMAVREGDRESATKSAIEWSRQRAELCTTSIAGAIEALAGTDQHGT